VAPTPVADPSLVQLNRDLARDLRLSVDWLESEAGLSLLAGNARPAEVDPIAMAYAGHQFGNWVPSLGDGRAIQIGEAVDAASTRWGLQLKGAGPTPFSRRGDGRAAIGPVLREYILSEAMFALGIPTTRALAFVATGESVYRERPEPGAILTRVARGFVRVGTFEYFAARGMGDELRTLSNFVINQRYPECADAENPYAALLERVVEVQAELIARWMLVGFIHGVMNTDNMSIFGETIDYGPCAFLDEYQPDKVFSSIDVQGRYAYDQQPAIGLWNLTRFAETLVPLLAEEQEAAIERAKDILGQYSGLFHQSYEEGLLRKVGLVERNESNRALAFELLDTMAAGRADFTATFRALSSHEPTDAEEERAARSFFDTPEAFDAWLERWRARLVEEGIPDEKRVAEMKRVNPIFIPRNHRVQQAIDAWVDHQDRRPFDELLSVTAHPFEARTDLAEYSNPPEPQEVVLQTFCGT
jgi:uncharacterized protein YdiU (UPF0061 family)